MMGVVPEKDEAQEPPRDMYSRDWATRNLGLLLLGGGTWIAWAATDWDSSKHPFKAAAGVSFGVTLAAMGLAALWGYVYIRRHPKELLTFWRDLQTRYRDWIFRGLAVIGGVATIGLVVAAVAGEPLAAGACAGPAFWSDFLVIANATGGIRPL
jgi:hypothetical protein